MEKALSLKPGFDAVNYNLACVHARLNNPASAVEALRKILGEKTKLERLGVPTEPDFLSMKSDEAFKEFLRAVGLVYQL
jgi:hypothetical protein